MEIMRRIGYIKVAVPGSSLYEAGDLVYDSPALIYDSPAGTIALSVAFRTHISHDLHYRTHYTITLQLGPAFKKDI